MSFVINKSKMLVLILGIISMMLLSLLRIHSESPVYNSNKNSTEQIAITFDDGPHPKRTLKILEILKKHDVKATFFVIGQNAVYYPEALKQIMNDGHEIANHTYSHKILKNMNFNAVLSEIQDTEKIIKNNGGKIEKIIRPPCGLFDNSLIKLANKDGYKIVLWNIDTHDWANESADSITSNIIKNVNGGDIILFHDYTSGENHTVEALDKIIPILKEKGYELVTVSQLLQ